MTIMAGERRAGPVCQVEAPVSIDTGTLCLAATPTPGTVGTPEPARLPPIDFTRADAFQEISIYLGAEATWDSVVRDIYNKGADAIRDQAKQLVQSGQMTQDQAKAWANAQRNALIEATRSRTGSIGRAIAELLKPSNKLKTAAELERLGKSAAGIIESSGKTNPMVNRVAVGMRYGGPALIIVGMSFSAYNIYFAPEGEGWRVTAREGGRWAGALAFGAAGGAGGCKAGAFVGTFFGPGPGTGIGCAVGATFGSIGGAIMGGWAGETAGEAVYRSLDGDSE